MLNIQQEKFVLNIINGMSQRQAYKDAYGATYSDKTIDENACRLFNESKIKTRYNELLNEMQSKAILTALEKRKLLRDISLDENNTMGDRLKALDIDNKMAGEYITKVDANVNADVTIDIKLDE